MIFVVFFHKILSRIPLEGQFVWIQVRPNILSGSLDPGHAKHFVRTDVGPNCLQKISVEDISRKKVNITAIKIRCVQINNLYFFLISQLKHVTIKTIIFIIFRSLNKEHPGKPHV